MSANLCTFDSTLTTFDSGVRTFDQTTCAAASAQGGGGRIKKPHRRRYLLPNDVLVWATQEEIVEILQPYIEAEQPKPQTKREKRKRQVRSEPFVPIEIHFEPMPDFSVQTLKPVLPQRAIWKPDLKAMKLKAEKLKRMIDDEEAILLFL